MDLRELDSLMCCCGTDSDGQGVGNQMSDVSKLTIGREPPADPFVEPLSVLASELNTITAQIHKLERSHLERMEAAAAHLRDRFASDAQKRLQSQFQTGVQIIREEFKERMRSATAQWEDERQSLLSEIEDVRRLGNRHNVALEVAQTEAALQALQKEIQAMVDDPAVELSRVIQKNTHQVELKGYLRGLKFKAGADASPTISKGAKASSGATAKRLA